MNPTIKTFLSNTFGWAEFEVEENIKKIHEALKHISDDGTVSGSAAAPGFTAEDLKALEDKNTALEGRVATLETEIEELLQFKSDMLGLSGKAPDPAPAAGSVSTSTQAAEPAPGASQS